VGGPGSRGKRKPDLDADQGGTVSPSFPITVAAGRVTQSDQLSVIISADDREMALIPAAHSPPMYPPTSTHCHHATDAVVFFARFLPRTASPDAMGFSPTEDRA
jgi:hypothetical protein